MVPEVYEILKSHNRVSKPSPGHLLQAPLVLLFEIRPAIQTWTLPALAKHARLHCETGLKGPSPSFAPMLPHCNISFHQSKMNRKELWG